MQRIRVPNGSMEMQDGWYRISIKGGPLARGKAHGLLLANAIEDSLRAATFVLSNSFGMPMKRIANLFLDVYGPVVEGKYKELYEEIQGIYSGMKTKKTKYSFAELFLWNMWYTLGYALSNMADIVENSPTLKQKYGDLFEGQQGKGGAAEGGSGASEKCTAFIAVGDWTKDGKIVCAHNTFDNFIDSQWVNVIMHIRPSKGNSIVMQTAPGQVASGTDYYVTSNGFIVSETTIGGFNAFKLGDPIFCRIRTAVQYSDNLDDYVDFLSIGNGGDYANSWLIGDTRNNEIMRIELGLKYVNVERKKNGYFIGFNAPYDDRIRNLECVNTGFYDIRRHQGARMVRLGQLMKEHKGKIDIGIGQDILADHYDVYLNKVNMCSRTCCSHYDIDQREFMSQADRPLPYQPRGALDGIVTDSTLAKRMGLSARWGSSCGTAFIAKDFCDRNMQWNDQRPYLLDRPSQPWSAFIFSKSKKGTRGRKINLKGSRKQRK
jgi:hypothetical protein